MSWLIGIYMNYNDPCTCEDRQVLIFLFFLIMFWSPWDHIYISMQPSQDLVRRQLDLELSELNGRCVCFASLPWICNPSQFTRNPQEHQVGNSERFPLNTVERREEWDFREVVLEEKMVQEGPFQMYMYRWYLLFSPDTHLWMLILVW